MEKKIKNFILLLLHFFFICYFAYSNKYIGNECYIRLLSFLSLEVLVTSIFFIFKKDKLFNTTIIFLSILSFLIVNFLDYLGMIYLEFSIAIIMLIELPIILYLFMLFLIKEKFIYFIYTILNLFPFTISLILCIVDVKQEFLELLILKSFIIYCIVYFLSIMLFKIKKKFTIIDILIKKDIKKNIFRVLHFLFIVSLIYNSQNSKAPHYEEVIIFISFELFGIIVFYGVKKYIENLYKKIFFYFLFCFLVIKIFEYLDKRIVNFLFMSMITEIILLILVLFVCSIIKRSKFYLGYALIELLWYIIFIFFNVISSTPELSGLELHILHILLAYIIVSYLYVSLFKKNESKRIEKYKNKESE